MTSIRNRERIALCAVLANGLVCLASGVQWVDDLYLGRGGLWSHRAEIAVETESAVTGLPVRVSLAALGIEASRADLRLTDETGTLLEFGPEGADIVIPVTGRGRSRYYVYWGNPSAWPLSDFWKGKPAASAPAPRVTVGAPETDDLAEVGADEPWLAADGGTPWLYRVPVRVVNRSAEAGPRMVSVTVPEIVHATRNAQMAMAHVGRRIDGCRLGEEFVFSLDVPARSIAVCWAYVGSGAAAAKPAGAESRGIGELPSDDRTIISGLDEAGSAAYRKMLESDANLLRGAKWKKIGGAAGVEWGEVSETPLAGVTGLKVSMSGDEGVVKGWHGYSRKVAAKPSSTYFFGGFARVAKAKSSVWFTLHVNGPRGPRHCTTPSTVLAEGCWQGVFGSASTDADTESVTLDLTTMARSGEFSFAGLFMGEFAPSFIGEVEHPPSASRGDAFAAAQVDTLVKVFPDVAPCGGRKPWRIALSRNEAESLQVAARSAADAEVEACLPFVEDRAGHRLVPAAGWVKFVPVDARSSYYTAATPEWVLRHPQAGGQGDGWSGLWPDPILPGAKAALVAGRTESVRFTFAAGPDAPAGVYRGEVEWKAGGRTVRRDPVEVEVWDFAIPARAECPALFAVNISRWPKDTRLDDIYEFMREYRIAPRDVAAKLEFRRAPSGEATADFSAWDRAAARMFDVFGFDRAFSPDAFRLFNWGHPPKDFLGEKPYEGKWPYEGVDRSALRPAYVRALQSATKLFYDHLREKGWENRVVFYVSDEPHLANPAIIAQMKAVCAAIHVVEPKARIYSSTWRHTPEWDGSLDIWGAGHQGGFPAAELLRRRDEGRPCWFTADGMPIIDTPLTATERLLPVYCAVYGAEAFENWGATWLTGDPWTRGWHGYVRESSKPGEVKWHRFPSGDGFMLYPPKDGSGRPCASIRLEAMRDGVEDFSYLKALERLGTPEARALLTEFRGQTPIPGPGPRYSTRLMPDPSRYAALRERTGALLSRKTLAK